MPKSPWRTIKRSKGRFDRWLRKQTQSGRWTFSREEIMKAHGMTLGRSADDGAFYQYFMDERKKWEEALGMYWGSGEYEAAKKMLEENGHSPSEAERQLHQHFVNAAISYNIFPFIADLQDHLYKILDLPSYLELKSRRAAAIGSEIVRSAKAIRTVQEKFPISGSRYEAPRLPPGADGYFLKPAGWPCPECGLVCEDNLGLMAHMEEEHGLVRAGSHPP